MRTLDAATSEGAVPGPDPPPSGGAEVAVPGSDAGRVSPAHDAGKGPDPVTDVDVSVPVPNVPPPEANPSISPPTGSSSMGADAGAMGMGVDAGNPSLEPSDDAAAPDAAGFAIDLVFVDDASIDESVKSAFDAAGARWGRVIVGDLPDAFLSESASCDGHPMPDTIDDVLVFVSVTEMDGPAGVLGAAAPCAIRGRAPRLPFAAVMNFDAADLDAFASAGRLEEIVLHEMGHALGIGSMWEGLGLVDEPSDGSGEADTAFNGSLAQGAFLDVGGDAYDGGNIVPVESRGNAGEINGHWRESVLGNELMTTRMGSATAVLSAVTIASLADMGYEVDVGAADPYSWPSEDGDLSFRWVGAPAETPWADLSHDLLVLPLYELSNTGTLSLARH